MQTPYFTKGQMKPIDPTKAVEDENQGEKSVETKDRRDGDSGGSSGRVETKEAKEGDEGKVSAGKQKEPVNRTESTGQQKQQQNGNNEANNGSFAGVRKILHPAEEALDSARHTAELIMKDAMDALIKTKQRLMEILPSLMPSHASAASDAAKVVENVEEDMLAKSEGAEPHAANGDDGATDEKLHPTDLGLTHHESTGVARNSTSGFQEPSSTEVQSVRRKLALAKL